MVEQLVQEGGAGGYLEVSALGCDNLPHLIGDPLYVQPVVRRSISAARPGNLG